MANFMYLAQVNGKDYDTLVLHEFLSWLFLGDFAVAIPKGSHICNRVDEVL